MFLKGFSEERGAVIMSFGESVLAGLFCILVVFLVLVLLWALIRVFSAIIKLVEQRQPGDGGPQGQKQ
jgi:Na+-transporting methylmalonyl-CoA/oxaloacetate decarboxylase gamma subunit